MLDEWVDKLATELELTDEIDADLLLDVARVAAHAVERRAAPITTFMIGLAAGRGSVDVIEGARRAERLAKTFQSP